jgi:hypothetical protein
MKTAWVVLVALTVASGARAQGALSTGEGYFSACIGSKIVPEAVCQAYVMGMHDSIVAAQGDKPKICLPPDFTYQRGHLMLTEAITRDTSGRHFPTANIYNAVLWVNYYCQ